MTETTPVRTCVGCGCQDDQRNMARLTVRTGVLALDGRVRAPGRGAYLHRDPDCWRAFNKRRGSIRSLRHTATQEDREALVATLSASAGEGAR